MTVLLNVLPKVAPGSGDEGVIGMFFIASISILLPAGAGAMIAAGLARVVYKRSTHKPCNRRADQRPSHAMNVKDVLANACLRSLLVLIRSTLR
jgi:hypothetical protein